MRRDEVKKLEKLRNALDDLQKFVYYFSGGDLPYFYRMLDYMKNNIEIYLMIQSEDLIGLEEVLYRDWYEANHMIYGIATFEISNKVCEESIELYHQYARLVQEVADYFVAQAKNIL